MKPSIFVMMLCTVLISQTSLAGAIRISPVKIDMTDNTSAQSLSLVNASNEPTNIQIRVFKWQQGIMSDDLLPTKEVVVSPPFAKIQPGQSYNIRVVRLDTKPVDMEKAYRVIIDELPTPVDTRKAENAINVVIRSSLPMFVVNKDAIADLEAQLVIDNNQAFIEVSNKGKRHAYLENLALIEPKTGKQTDVQVNTVNGYILAGSHKRFAVPIKSFNYQPNVKYQISLRSNGQSKVR